MIAVWLVIGYVLGSIPASYLAGRLAGIDLREHGSKNLGATNVYRVLGWRFAIPVGLFDIGKGLAAVLGAQQALGAPGLAAAVGAAAVVGHVFPVFLRFRGGKGVATAGGVVLGLAPMALGASALVWLVLVFATGYVSAASMLGALSFPLWAHMLYPAQPFLVWAGLGIAAFIVFTHRANLRRLWHGTENRVGRRRSRPAEGQA